MAITSVSLDFMVLIVAATAFGVVARKTGQPTVIAYLITGIILGPIGFDLVTETPTISFLSELGLAFLLFLIGIEMDFGEIKSIFSPIMRISVFQRILQTLLVFAITWLLGFSLLHAFVLSLVTVIGSTAEIVKLFADNDKLSTLPSKINIGVLLFQDVVVVLVMAILSSPAGGVLVVAKNIATVLALVSTIFIISNALSRYLLPRHFRSIAGDKHTFFIHGVGWLFLFVTISQYLNISIEIGAFIAGLSIGQIQFSDELQERIRPLTDFFVAIFFSGLGLQMTTETLFQYWREAIISSFVFGIGNMVILFWLIDAEQFTPETSFKASITMTQVSEFSLVVGGVAVANGYLGQAAVGYLSLMAMFTMGISAYLIAYNDLFYQKARPVLRYFDSQAKQDTEIDALQDHAVIIGYNDLIERILPSLKQYVDDIIIVDRHPDNVDHLTQAPYEYIFGDIRHGEIRKGVSLESARIVLSVSTEFDVHATIMADVDETTIAFMRSTTPDEAAELYDLGADYIIRKNMLTAEQIRGYIDTYLNDREAFKRETEDDRARIEWGARDGG